MPDPRPAPAAGPGAAVPGGHAPAPPRRYRYVGPADLRAAVRPGDGGTPVRSPADLAAWGAARAPDELAEPFTYTVDPAGVLCLAPRRGEHVACAGGGRVLGAGELGLRREPDGWAVTEVSNHSTGYCPDATSWPAVAAALAAGGLTPPPGFTHEVVFRRCERCRETGIVRDGDFVCVFCGADLPLAWNVDPEPDRLA